MRKLLSFINSERDRFETLHNNKFAFTFSQITRHYDFLLIIVARHKKISKAGLDNLKKLQNSLNKSPGSHTMTDLQVKTQEEGSRITTKLHLEIESFYLFAKIMLDETARAIEFYFGQARKLSLDSHSLLSKNLISYAANKDLILSNDFVDLAKKLKKEIADFRDYQIAHHKNPRTTRGTVYDATGARMSLISIYPKPNDKQVESSSLEELMKVIDAYISSVISFLKQNSERTHLKLDTK